MGILNSQVDGSLQGQRLSRAADVFVPKLRSGAARPAGSRATGRNNRHFLDLHDDVKTFCKSPNGD